MKYPITNRYGETVEPTGHIRERIAAAILRAGHLDTREIVTPKSGCPIQPGIFSTATTK
jgi:hypothetical protein